MAIPLWWYARISGYRCKTKREKEGVKKAQDFSEFEGGGSDLPTPDEAPSQPNMTKRLPCVRTVILRFRTGLNRPTWDTAEGVGTPESNRRRAHRNRQLQCRSHQDARCADRDARSTHRAACSKPASCRSSSCSSSRRVSSLMWPSLRRRTAV